MRRSASYCEIGTGCSVASCFWENVAHASRSPALWQCSPGGTPLPLSWRELGERAARYVGLLQLADSLPRRGTLFANRHIASCLPNCLEWILLDIAAQTLGWVHVAVDFRESPGRQQSLVDFSQSRWLVQTDASGRSRDDNAPGLILCDRQTGSHQSLANCSLTGQTPSLAQCQALAQSVDIDSPTQLLFTSGSVGQPKGVMLSHRNLLSNALAKLDAAPQDSCDLRLNILPFAHAYARTCELSSWIATGGQLGLAKDWPDMLRQARVLNPSLINLVPYLAQLLADALDADRNALGRRLRLLQVGGAALNDALWQRLQQHGLPPLQGYGLTEAGPVVCSNRAGSQRRGSVGPAVKGVEIRIDEQQVLWCRGPNVMLGYWDDADATAQVIEAGWLRTGDLARFEEGGHVSILGRASQQIVLSTGYKVCPEPIERQLQIDPWIERVLIFGDGHPHVVALIWPVDDCSQSQLATLPERIQQRLGDFPRYAIPRNFAIMRSPLTQAQGLLTLKGVPRRRQIADVYRQELQQLYR